MHRIVSIEVEIYKIAADQTETNLYNESSKKVYYNPMRFFALINKDPIDFADSDIGMDVNQSIQFKFLRQDLVECGLVLSEGDIIKFDERFYEIDNTQTTQYWGGKNPQTYLMGTEGRANTGFGYNVAIVAQTHLTKVSNLHIVESRSGITKQNNYPKNN